VAEKFYVGNLHVRHHPAAAETARQRDGVPHKWATEPVGSMVPEYREAVTLPQSVSRIEGE
jgi:hypothetical protein